MDRIEDLFNQADPHMVPEDSSDMKSESQNEYSDVQVSDEDDYELEGILNDGTVKIE